MYPARISYGVGVLDDFISSFKLLGKKKLLLISISELLDVVEEIKLELSSEGISVTEDFSITHEPTFADLDYLLDKARKNSVDSIMALGGGSVMDVAKMVAAMLDLKQDARQFAGIGLLPSRNTYLVCVPTTAGTGSEVSPNAIFLDELSGGKKGVISPFLVPDVAVVDPALTYGVPANITAATGVDAFTHCLEAYVNNFSHPMIDLYAMEGMRLIVRSLLTAVQDGNNAGARAEVALGSLYGGMCLGPVNTGAIHALSYPLGSKFKLPHGLSNALLMPYVVEYNAMAAADKYAKVALLFDPEMKGSNEDLAKEGIRLMHQWVHALALPAKLSSVGIRCDDIESLANDAMQVQRLLKNNVRKIEFDDAVSIYQKAY